MSRLIIFGDKTPKMSVVSSKKSKTVKMRFLGFRNGMEQMIALKNYAIVNELRISNLIYYVSNYVFMIHVQPVIKNFRKGAAKRKVDFDPTSIISLRLPDVRIFSALNISSKKTSAID